jgi:hypothetical protein
MSVSSDLQRFDSRPPGACEHCESEALAVKYRQGLVPAEVGDLVRRRERELVSGYRALPLFGWLRKPLLKAMDLSRGLGSVGCEPFQESHD